MLGKIENLRVACLAFDAVALRRGETLSFWAQVGRPTRRRGFTIGRELREGCLIPTVGGGLCQLSNALYKAAIACGKPVIATAACGLGELSGWTEVPVGDTVVLRAVLRRLCERDPTETQAPAAHEEAPVGCRPSPLRT